jgi:hypothetical protein
MENDDTTNLIAEAPEAEAAEVDKNEALADEFADEADTDGEGLEDDEELDIDGDPIRVPKTLAEKLKARMMMQADYTQKTQALAEQRKALEVERQATQWEAETKQQLFQEEAQLLTVRQRLEQFQGVNWAALAQQDMQQHAVMQAEYTQLKDFHDRLSGHVEGRRSELNSKVEHERAISLERAVQHLNSPKPDIGWDGKFDADKRANLTKFGMELGFTNEELSNTSHPLMIQTLNLARIGYETLRKQNASLKQAAPQAKPVPTVATGKTRTGPSNPDKLSTEEWLKWRESSLAKQRQRNR